MLLLFLFLFSRPNRIVALQGESGCLQNKEFPCQTWPWPPPGHWVCTFYCVACHLGLFRYGSPRHQRPLPAKNHWTTWCPRLSQLLLGIVLGHLWRQGCQAGRLGMDDDFQKDSFQAEQGINKQATVKTVNHNSKSKAWPRAFFWNLP